ncbi:MAG TPA: 7-cyano-7-deazaguanine synthase QueC [Thermoanaerobaculia bacterium]
MLSKRANCIVLLSGGMDSLTAMVVAMREGKRPWALTFSYGQRNVVEVQAARTLGNIYAVVGHSVVGIDMRSFGSNALTGTGELPTGRSISDIQRSIPSTYVPARNTIFLAYAIGWAEVMGVSEIVVGFNCDDAAGYPDCRPQYLEAFEQMANLATKRAVEGKHRVVITSPFINYSKQDIVRIGLELGVDYSRAVSCYSPSMQGAACGACDACVIRLDAFKRNAAVDPAIYTKD